MKWKDTKFKSFLDKVGSAVKDNSGKLMTIAGSAATGNFSTAISETVSLLTGEDTSEAKALLAELEIKRKEFELEERKLVIADRDSARDMQASALSQEDLFSKRFIYYLATGVFAFSALIVVMLFFVEIPEENQRIVDMVLGVIVGSGLVSVLNFFYGANPEVKK
jgi:hypothetical protein|tara:strand:- start:13989 stop:14483 length:495 start_codon:yes stop_codon:yes gene_type:complete